MNIPLIGKKFNSTQIQNQIQWSLANFMLSECYVIVRLLQTQDLLVKPLTPGNHPPGRGVILAQMNLHSVLAGCISNQELSITYITGTVWDFSWPSSNFLVSEHYGTSLVFNTLCWMLNEYQKAWTAINWNCVLRPIKRA